ncbi:MAG: hypothetical protein N2317_04015 [Syntrophales bacterium]|nr:hypothetical protein [Syntrophales bacterium]
MHCFLVLLRPRILSFRLLTKTKKETITRFIFFALMTIVLWVGIFVFFHRILSYFQRTEVIGNILASKLLYMIIVTLFTLLIFSSIIILLTRLYLSADLISIHALPAKPEEIFLTRLTESFLDSSWMVVLFGFPVLLAYGKVFHASFHYYPLTLITIIFMCITAVCISAILVLLVTVLLPAGRLRVIFILIGTILITTLIFAIRLLRPEQLVNPETFLSLAVYLRTMEAIPTPAFPTTWIYDAIMGILLGDLGQSIFNIALIGTFSISLIFVSTWCSASIYFTGFSKAQTTSQTLFRPLLRNGYSKRAFSFLPPPIRGLVIKEIITFWRDARQWPQVFLIAALIIIYLYNFAVLPIDKTPLKAFYLQNILSFMNMGLATFVMAAIAARFVFPAVSMEEKAFWIVKSAPISLQSILWVKFGVYLIPLFLLAEFLTVVSNILLGVTPFMMALSTVTVLLMTPAVVGLGVGIGAAFPDFSSENPAQSITSFGGLLYMTLSIIFIAIVILLESLPVYHLFLRYFTGKTITPVHLLLTTVSFAVVIILCLLTTVLPIKLGAKKLNDL